MSKLKVNEIKAFTGTTVTLSDVTTFTSNSSTIRIGNSTNEIDTASGNLTIDSAGGTVTVDDNLVISGNLTVNGTTSTINSTVTTIDDPIITLGGDTAPTLDDNKDRGVEFRYYDAGTDYEAKVGFFGYSDNNERFVFIEDATNSSERFTGTRGDIEASGFRVSDDGSTFGIQIGVTGNNEIDTASGNLTIDSAGGTVTVDDNLVVSGNLTVNGTTSTINSTVTTVDDPVITLGGDVAPGSDDNKDRGIEFRYHTGSAAKLGFFGYDDSTGRFTFVPDASNSSEVFSGNRGELEVGGLRVSEDGTQFGIQIGVTGNNEIDTASGNLTLDSAGGTVAVDDNLTVSGDLVVDTNALKVDSTSNFVGIGTASPGVRLEVQDTTTSSANTGGALRLSANDGAPMGDSHRLGVIEFTGAEDSSNTQVVGARIEAITDAAWTNVENGCALYFYTTDGNASQTNVLKIDSNKKSTFNGNVQVNGDIDLTGSVTTSSLEIAYDSNNLATLGVDKDGTLTISAKDLDSAGDYTEEAHVILDAEGMIQLDSAASKWQFKKAGSGFLTISESGGGHINISAKSVDQDIRFKGLDGTDTNEITALKLDMSAGGRAEFSSDVRSAGSIWVTETSSYLGFGTQSGSPDVQLTHSSNVLTLTGGVLVLPDAGLQVGASVPFSDSTGTLTLQNIDAIDATTEATIEAAVDALANLTSVGQAGNELEAAGSLDVAEGIKVNNTQVISSARQLRNITSLGTTTKSSIETAITTLGSLTSVGTVGGAQLDINTSNVRIGSANNHGLLSVNDEGTLTISAVDADSPGDYTQDAHIFLDAEGDVQLRAGSGVWAFVGDVSNPSEPDLTIRKDSGVAGGIVFQTDQSPQIGPGLFSATPSPEAHIEKRNGEIVTTILLNLNGLTAASGGSSDKHVIGGNSSPNSYIFQVNNVTNGFIYKVEMYCIQAPSSTDADQKDINLVANTDANQLQQGTAFDTGGTSITLIDRSGQWAQGEARESGSTTLTAGLSNYYIAIAAGTNVAGGGHNYNQGKYLIKLRGADF